METPMWRRGPTGKGTLCNACGVKWSLKFRKRAGKKSSKVEKIRDDGSQQRTSSRKKITSKKSTDDVDAMDNGPKEESSPHDHTHVGLCCNHSQKRKERDEDDSSNDWKKRSRDANQEYDSLSDDASPQSHQLFGKLLNVVEVQLVEEEELERIKAQMRILRKDLETNESSREREITQIKNDSLDNLNKLKGEIVGVHVERFQDKVAKECSEVLHSFMKNVRSQLDEARKTIANSQLEGIESGLLRFETEADRMTQTMDANFAKLTQKASNDVLRIQTMFLNQEDTIRSRWAHSHKELKHVFAPLHDRMEIIEDPIMKTH